MPFSEPTIKIAPPPSPTDRQKMVGWFDPGPLIGVATNVLVSTLFGRHSDYRLVEALATQGAEEEYDFSLKDGAPRQELWLDYTADTGDGFDSTYAVAYWLTRDNLDAVGPDGATQRTRCGDVLVLGGDLVYPSASRGDYHRKLVRPFETARNYSRAPEPYIFALPGNHDWYDSLVSFSRLFCSGRWFQGWRTAQKRSYFALKLPHNWWLLGADVQLGSDIDAFQVEYFKKVASRMQPGDRVILCTAEPHWIYSAMYRDVDPDANENNIEYFEKVLRRRGARVVLYLGGDLHHYRRHEGADGSHKVTAGGGGAFLHPTHGLSTDKLSGGYELKAAYPDPARSRRMAWRNLLFLFINPRFGVVTGAIYAFIGWSWSLGGLGLLLGIAVVCCGFMLFTDTHSVWYRRIAGTFHGAANVAIAVALLRWAGQVTAGMDDRVMLPEVLTATILFAGGWIFGSLVIGLYFLLSLNVFGRHSNEAFSALRIPDFKHFLRLHIDGDGRLTLFPLGIDRVPRDWKPAAFSDGYAAQLVPDDPRATPPRSIEPAVVIGG